MQKTTYLIFILLWCCSTPQEEDASREQLPETRYFYLKQDAYGVKNAAGKVLLHYSESDSFFIAPEKVNMLHLHPNWKRKTFPTEVFNFPNVRELWLGMRDFKAVPETIAQLKELRSLDFQNGGLERLPDNIGELKHLEELTLLFSSVERLPLSICELSNLKNLHLGGTKIRVLPDCLHRLEKLEEFIIFDEDGSKTLPADLLEQINALQQQLPNCSFHID